VSRARPTASTKALTLALAASLLALLLIAGAPRAHAADLGEKLEATEGKLQKVRERKGVLTSTISRYGDRIEALTGQVAAIRDREATARQRLVGKQAELGEARAALAGAKVKLVRARAHLQVALGALRQHLVSIYESGSPDLLSVIVGATGMEDLAARAEYLDRIRGLDEAVAGRVRDLRNEVRDLVVTRLNSKVRIERARDYIAGFAQRLLDTRAALQNRQGMLAAARGQREAALHQIVSHEEELDGSVESIQTEIVEQLRSTGSGPLAAGPAANGWLRHRPCASSAVPSASPCAWRGWAVRRPDDAAGLLLRLRGSHQRGSDAVAGWRAHLGSARTSSCGPPTLGCQYRTAWFMAIPRTAS